MSEYGIASLGIDAFGVAVPPLASSTNASLTATTSTAEVRAALVATIEAIVPNDDSGVRFRYTDSERADFRSFAEENETTALREFAIQSDGWQMVAGYDALIQRRSATLSVVVAYPHHWASYRGRNVGNLINVASLEDTAESDLSLIMSAIGIAGAANYPQGACPISETYAEPDVADGVTFAVADIEIEYFYDTRV